MATLSGKRESVTHVSGMKCYLCVRKDTKGPFRDPFVFRCPTVFEPIGSIRGAKRRQTHEVRPEGVTSVARNQSCRAHHYLRSGHSSMVRPCIRTLYPDRGLYTHPYQRKDVRLESMLGAFSVVQRVARQCPSETSTRQDLLLSTRNGA